MFGLLDVSFGGFGVCRFVVVFRGWWATAGVVVLRCLVILWVGLFVVGLGLICRLLVVSALFVLLV